jgi:hypothetical protein
MGGAGQVIRFMAPVQACMRRYQIAESMVKHAIELDPELKSAQKLKQYIDAKNRANTLSQN